VRILTDVLAKGLTRLRSPLTTVFFGSITTICFAIFSSFSFPFLALRRAVASLNRSLSSNLSRSYKPLQSSSSRLLYEIRNFSATCRCHKSWVSSRKCGDSFSNCAKCVAEHACNIGLTRTQGRSPRETKLFEFMTQRRSAKALNVGMAGLRSMMGASIGCLMFLW